MKRLLLLLFVISATVYPQNIPNYVGYVNDFANILSPQSEQELTQKIVEYEKQSSIEIAVVTTNDIQGTYIEEYSIKLAEKWKVGKKGLDNGLILFVSLDPNDRGFRIEVGRGLEGRMTDLDARRITDYTVQNYFKQSKFDDGMTYALDKVLETVGPETQEQYAAFQVQKEKESQQSHEAFMSGLYTFLIIFGCLGIISAVVVFVWKSIAKQKRLEKERIDEENNLKDNIIETLASIIKIENEVEKYSKIGFSNSSDVYKEVISAKERVRTVPTTGKTTSEYQLLQGAINTNYYRLMQSLKKLQNEWATKISVEKAPDIITKFEKDISEAIAENKKIIAEINASNPKSVWGNEKSSGAAHAKLRIEDAKSYYADAVKFLSKKEFEKAQAEINAMLSALHDAVKFANEPKALKEKIENAKQYVKDHLPSINELVLEAKRSVERNHVKPSTKMLVNDIDAEKVKVIKASTADPLNYIILAALVLGFVTVLNGIIANANRDISEHMEAIRRQEERRRQEEQRRQDEEDQRRRNSYNNSHSSGGGMSFGGGGFSGGGSTSRW